jgi:uncharacterized repeat protein (TIGR03943 family)
MQTAVKALLLLALALFLYSRIANDTILFYIHQSFVPYTMLAIMGLIIVASGYRPPRRSAAGSVQVTGSDAESGATGGHDHTLTLSGLLLVLLPIVIGVLAPPQPLGAAAVDNREISMSLQTSSLPAAVAAAAAKNVSDRNVLDWLQTFAGSQNPTRDFAGQPAKITGFVFRDQRFGDDQFLVARYVISCCVADAYVTGLVIRWPQAAELAADQWVEVSGVFEPGKLGSESLPVLSAQTVINVDVPVQPYLYP